MIYIRQIGYPSFTAQKKHNSLIRSVTSCRISIEEQIILNMCIH